MLYSDGYFDGYDPSVNPGAGVGCQKHSKQTNKHSNRHSKQTNIFCAWKTGLVPLFGTAILIPLSSNHNSVLAKPNWQVKLSQQLPTDSDTPFFPPPLNDGQQGSPLVY